eukprot:497069-Pelagomonas_calceolata.AAC.1
MGPMRSPTSSLDEPWVNGPACTTRVRLEILPGGLARLLAQLALLACNCTRHAAPDSVPQPNAHLLLAANQFQAHTGYWGIILSYCIICMHAAKRGNCVAARGQVAQNCSALRRSDYVWLMVIGSFAAFMAAWGIGANDVANSFATSACVGGRRF